MLFNRTMKIMSIHECKWSGTLVVRWQLTDQAYLDRNLEKILYLILFFKSKILFLYFTSSRGELYIFRLYLVAFILIIS